MPHTTSTLDELRRKYLPNGLTSVSPVIADRALGASLWDRDGRHYIDFVGGIGVQNIGHNHPRVVSAIKEQADRFIHTCIQVTAYEPYLQLARELSERADLTGPAKAIMFSTGAEAVENSIKFAKAFTGRNAVIAFDGAFHGRTHYALALTGKEYPYKRGFNPNVADVYRARYPYPYRCPRRNCPATGQACSCSNEIEELFLTDVAPQDVAAIIFEPVLGEGGFVPADPQFLADVRALCDRHGILLIVDEIQTGFGRTGRLFAVEHSGVQPDIIITAKSLAAGLPLSAVIGRADILDSVHAGGVGGTYAGNPLACAAALAVLSVIDDEDVLGQAEALGRKLRSEFEALAEEVPEIGEVRGLGAMLAIEFVRDRQTKEPNPEFAQAVVREGQHHGVLLMTAGRYGNVLRCLLPLTASEDEVQQGLSRLRQAVAAARRPVLVG